MLNDTRSVETQARNLKKNIGKILIYKKKSQKILDQTINILEVILK